MPSCHKCVFRVLLLLVFCGLNSCIQLTFGMKNVEEEEKHEIYLERCCHCIAPSRGCCKDREMPRAEMEERNKSRRQARDHIRIAEIVVKNGSCQIRTFFSFLCGDIKTVHIYCTGTRVAIIRHKVLLINYILIWHDVSYLLRIWRVWLSFKCKWYSSDCCLFLFCFFFSSALFIVVLLLLLLLFRHSQTRKWTFFIFYEGC